MARSPPTALLPRRVASDARQAPPERALLREASLHLRKGDVVAGLTSPAVFVVAGARVLYTDEDPLLPDREARRAALAGVAAGGSAVARAVAAHPVRSAASST